MMRGIIERQRNKSRKKLCSHVAQISVRLLEKKLGRISNCRVLAIGDESGKTHIKSILFRLLTVVKEIK